MKRQPRILTKPSSSGRALDARRLTHVRGGDGLGIDVSTPDPTPPSFMQQQHNEALVRL